MKIKPIFDRVLIKPQQIENVTKSGIMLMSSNKARPEIGKVVAVGDGENFDGNKVEMKVRVGDTVIFNKYAALYAVANLSISSAVFLNSFAFPSNHVQQLCIIIIDVLGIYTLSPAIAIIDAAEAAMPSIYIFIFALCCFSKL